MTDENLRGLIGMIVLYLAVLQVTNTVLWLYERFADRVLREILRRWNR